MSQPFDAAAASTAYRRRARGHRGRRAERRRRDPQRAGRPARVAEADRQRELRLPRRAADDGQLALATSTPRARSGTASTPAARTSTPSSRRPPTTPRRCSARRTPTSSRTRASTPTSSRSGRSWPSASSRRRWRRPAPSTSTTCPRHDWADAAPGARRPARARHVAGRRRPPHPRLPPEHQRQDVRPVLLRHRSRDRPARLRRWCARGRASSSRSSSSPATRPTRARSTSPRCARSPTRSAPR